MKLKKNFRAKLAAIVASTLALGGTWVLVRHNPPPADAGTDQVPPATSTATAPQSRPSSGARQQPAQPKQSTNRHTRTRAS